MAETLSRPELTRLPMLTEVVAEAEAPPVAGVLLPDVPTPAPGLAEPTPGRWPGPAAAPAPAASLPAWPQPSSRPTPPPPATALPVLTESLDALLAPLSEGPLPAWSAVAEPASPETRSTVTAIDVAVSEAPASEMSSPMPAAEASPAETARAEPEPEPEPEPELPAAPARQPIDDAALVEAVLAGLQPRIERLVDERLRQHLVPGVTEAVHASVQPALRAAFESALQAALQPALSAAVESAMAQWLPEARSQVMSTLRDVVAQAVADEAARAGGG